MLFLIFHATIDNFSILYKFQDDPYIINEQRLEDKIKSKLPEFQKLLIEENKTIQSLVLDKIEFQSIEDEPREFVGSTIKSWQPSQVGYLANEQPICKKPSGSSVSQEISNLHLTKQECKDYAAAKGLLYQEHQSGSDPPHCSITRSGGHQSNPCRNGGCIYYNRFSGSTSNCYNSHKRGCIHKCPT